MSPVLRYQPHFLIGIELDAEWSRARNVVNGTVVPDPIAAVKQRIEKVCADYRQSVDKLGQLYANQSPLRTPSILAPHLFNPLFCLPSGHADGLALILIDDFDAVHHIASHSRVIEDMSLAFCPAVDSYGYEAHPVIKDIEEHWSQETLPVRMLARYKLDSLCSLEFGLLFKRAVFRAMAKRVEKCIEHFRGPTASSEQNKDNFLVTFLAMQGQEEIGVLCSGADATMVVALSSALRSLTLPDLFPESERDPQTQMLRDLLLDLPLSPLEQNWYAPGRLHRSLFSPSSVSEKDFCLPKTPVFRWSKSVLGFRLHEVDGKLVPSARIEGTASLDLEFQFIPGIPVAIDQFVPPLEGELPAPEGQRFAEVGNFDFRCTIGSHRPVIPVDKAVRHILACVRSIVEGNHTGKRPGILGIKSVFSIAIPACEPFFINGEVAESELDRKLYRIRRLIDSPDNEGSFMSLNDLLAKPQTYSLPRALRRSIESLFRNFLTAVANPNLFDLVIDLYDAFNTLHRVLVVVLPDKLKTVDGQHNSIHPQRVIELAEFATVLRNALERRLALAYPDSTVRNVSLQFPGSLAQILLSSDAPLKAGLGVLKYHLPASKGESNTKDTSLKTLHHVGVVADITLQPGIRTINFAMETSDEPKGQYVRLSYLYLDVDHLFHVGSYFDYIHEAFHLVFDELVTRQARMEKGSMGARFFQEILIRERVEETFVQLASFMFCSPGKPSGLLRYLLGKYALDMRSSLGTPAARISHFAERFVLLSIASWLVSSRLAGSKPLAADEDWLPELIAYAEKELEVSFELFPETAEKDQESLAIIKEACIEHIRVFVNEAQFGYYLPELWSLTLELYGKLVDDQQGFSISERLQYDTALAQVEDGWALTRFNQKSTTHLNSVAATALLLGQYITRHSVAIRHTPGTRYQLDRNPITKDVEFRFVPYADYLIDRGAAQRFCFKPEARASRLRNQIAVIESFWDFSSHFRARRVMDLLVRFHLD